jgi:hypothetical protein
MAKYPEIEPIQSTIGKILLYINVTMERWLIIICLFIHFLNKYLFYAYCMQSMLLPSRAELQKRSLLIPCKLLSLDNQTQDLQWLLNIFNFFTVWFWLSCCVCF